ncbi:MAG: transposase [Planctomycetes bacterium]|nr:transposase [Planctomycetota bacterium]
MFFGFFITFTTYGTWLHGDERGSWDRNAKALREYFVAPDPRLVESMRLRMNHPAITLDGPMRKCVREGVHDHCLFKQWQLHALAVRSNHVHVVLTPGNRTAQQAMVALKARATVLLRGAKLLGEDRPVWTERGSKIPLNTRESFDGAVHYVLHEQGPDLPDD